MAGCWLAITRMAVPQEGQKCSPERNRWPHCLQYSGCVKVGCIFVYLPFSSRLYLLQRVQVSHHDE